MDEFFSSVFVLFLFIVFYFYVVFFLMNFISTRPHITNKMLHFHLYVHTVISPFPIVAYAVAGSPSAR